MTRRKLPPIDIRDMYTELTAYDREYIVDTYGGCGQAIKLLVKGGKYEQAVKEIEDLRSKLQLLIK
jgi:hypothetical protein